MTTRDLSAGIRLAGLTKDYPGPHGPVHAVASIDLAIRAGETVALLGPNGAGKSTTIDMMLGLVPPDSGTVSLFGMTPAQAVAAGSVAAMLQTGGLIHFVSVRELVALTASLYPDPLDVDEVITLTGISDFADQRTNKLSGGQVQRVRAAIALVANSDLLVLDEPTVALDVEGRRQFWAFMRGVAASGKTVLFATHYLEEADAFADRIVLVARGRVVADGPTTEIKATVGLRTIRGTLPGADEARLAAVPGVSQVQVHGSSVLLRCTDSDAAIRSLLANEPGLRDVEIAGAGLEEAFLALTGDVAEPADAQAADAQAADARSAGIEKEAVL